MSRLLGGRYDLQEEIGGGGMAVVYRAMDTLLGRQVAVKMLRSQFADDEEFVHRFRREAQSAASLSHPNIVSLYDVGVADNSGYYIVMEYVDGPTLKDVIRERAPLSVKETLDITRQICDALEHAHEHNIIHRDIKPHNILLTKTGHVKVTDFGIARATSGNTITHHHSRSVLGSVHYFSPEQARGGATDVKSDIYSLGVVMYEMLTGRLPFSGDSPVSVALKHLRERFVEPRELDKSIPQSVENIVLRCLAKSPDARYPNMRALKQDLQDALIHPNVPKFVAPDEVPDDTIAIPVLGNGKLGGYTQADESDNTPQPRRRWWNVLMWSGVAFAVLCVGAIAAYYIVIELIQVPNVNLPDVRGKTEAQAIQILEQNGFAQSQIKERYATNDKPKGTVYDQDPEGNTEVKRGRIITLWVSNGPQQLKMPDLQGVPLDEAITTLTNMGIPQANIKEMQVPSAQYDVGSVVNTTPSANAPLTTDTQITLQVSGGAQTTVPYVIGMTLDQAKQALIQANLTPGQVTRMANPAPDGTVFDTAPYKPGAQVPPGTVIELYVADNSGESGGGLGTGSNNQTGGSSGSLPPGTVAKALNVTVKDTSGQPLHVQIYKTDVQGTQQLVVDQTIRSTTSWSVTVYVTPTVQGELLVFENDQLKQDYQVSYGS